MTHDWDFYFSRVDDRIASFFVDLGARRSAPVEGLRFRCALRLFLNELRPDGLSRDREFDRLVEIEQRLEADSAQTQAAYVGRCTTNSRRDFYFYAPDADAWRTAARSALSAFPGYRFELDVAEDPAWTTYCEFLHPDERDMQRIQNRRVCDTLEKHGDALTAVRDVDHWTYFKDAGAREAFISAVTPLGFAVRVLSESNETTARYAAQIWRADVPSSDGIDEITLPLFDLARAHGGEYDGWETSVEKEPESK